MTKDRGGDKPLRVFISYSHDSAAHADRVLALANRLRRDGIDVWIDQYEVAPSRGWPQWMKDQVSRADFVLCVCTETYRRRFDQLEVSGKGLGVTWEAVLVVRDLYQGQGKNEHIVPVLFDPQDTAYIPAELKAFSYYCLETQDGYEELYRRLLSLPQAEAPRLGTIRTLSTQPRRSLLGANVETAPVQTLPDDIAAYVQWAKANYDHLDLIGIDAGEVHVPFDEVYVPLKMAHQAPHDDVMGFLGSRREAENQDVELPDVLRHDGGKQALIFGEPGSGKTTAMLKLHYLCLQNPASLDLPDGTVPVFLRLRHFRAELLEEGLKAFIEHEVRQLSGDRVPAGIGEALWNYRRLLLLFDGLDELGDAPYRTQVLQRLGWFLGDAEAAQMRAVVTCRRVGLPRYDSRDAIYQAFSVRPFQNDQIRLLVQRWFREHERLGKISKLKAEQRQRTILDTLLGPEKASQQILEMVSNPLLLTLLCVVVLQGNEIPKRRVHFFRQCLHVMLDRWPEQRKGGKACPVDLHLARQALGRLAFFLHRQKRRDDLDSMEAKVALKGVLGSRVQATHLFNWLHQEAGLIVDYTDRHYGFAHLALQEYLVAYHLNEEPGDLDQILGDFDEGSWKEVFLQLSALSSRGFTALMTWLIHQADALEQRSQLLRQCLAEAKPPDLSAFVEVLRNGEAPQQGAVLRLLLPVEHRPGELLEVIRSLAAQAAPEVRGLAKRFLEAEQRGRQTAALLLYGPEEDQSKAEELQGLLADWSGGHAAFVAQASRCGDADEACCLVVALVGASSMGWDRVEIARQYYDDLSWLVVTLPGEPRPRVPEVFDECEVFHWQLDDDAALLRWITERLRRVEALEPPEAPEPLSRSRSAVTTRGGASVPEMASQDVWVEPVTGMEFLQVPGGRFVMGSDRLFTEAEEKMWQEADLDWIIQASAPASPVRLSPFWLGKTPVTNAQYAHFLKAIRHPEPKTWRDRRYSAQVQPVISVSWEDAQAYCQWLTETSSSGRIFQLPSEAQWEFAARGPKNRVYPWGYAPPRGEHACLGLNYEEDAPAEVGSFPEGVGPFGHLDLAGLVWEWCRDAWEEDHSYLTKLKEPLDPVGEADLSRHPVRGGAWLNSAINLRSAMRYWSWPDSGGDGLGFRVLFSHELDV